jgi:hypothetical protein
MLYRDTPEASQDNGFTAHNYVPGMPTVQTTKKSREQVSRDIVDAKRKAGTDPGRVYGMSAASDARITRAAHLMRPRAGQVVIEPRGGGERRAAMKKASI